MNDLYPILCFRVEPKEEMELYLKITVGLFLLVQAFNLASLQYSTNPPRHTIDKSWLRELPKSKNGSQNTVVPGEGREHDHKADGAKELSNDDHSGIPSGSMAIFTEEEENVAHQNIGENEGEMNDITEPPDLLNATTKAPESPNAKTSPTNATKVSTNSSQANITVTEDELVNSTAIPQTSTIDLSAQNSTSGFLDDLDSPTTLAPVSNDTQESTIQPTEDTRSANSTESTNTSMTTSVIPKTTSTSLSTMEVYTSTITEISPETSTPAELNTPEMVNKTGKGSATGGGSERGMAVGVTLSGFRYKI